MELMRFAVVIVFIFAEKFSGHIHILEYRWSFFDRRIYGFLCENIGVLDTFQESLKKIGYITSQIEISIVL